MKWWRACWLAALATLPIAEAQSSLLEALPMFPGCAVSCFTAAAPQTTCLPTNDTCLCHDQTMTVIVGACIQSNCTVRQALFTQNLTMSVCGFPVRDQSPSYEILSIALLTVTGLLVILRITVRHVLLIGLGPDDWAIILTMLLIIGSTVISIHGLKGNGLGRDLWTINPDHISTFLRYFQASAVLYFIEITLIKVSLLLFYLRIFPSQRVVYIIWAAIAFNAIYGLIYVFVICFMCHPISYFWNQWDGEHRGQCADLNALSVSNAAMSIFADVVMILIPLFQIGSLNLDWKKKLGIGFMFLMGTFVTIISILRFRFVLKFSKNRQDPTWDYMPVAIWTVLEIDIGVICTCLPTVRTFLAHTFTKTFGTIGQSNDKSYNSAEGWQARSNNSKKNPIISTISRYSFSGPKSPRTNASGTNDNSDTDEAGLVELREMQGSAADSRIFEGPSSVSVRSLAV